MFKYFIVLIIVFIVSICGVSAKNIKIYVTEGTMCSALKPTSKGFNCYVKYNGKLYVVYIDKDTKKSFILVDIVDYTCYYNNRRVS